MRIQITLIHNSKQCIQSLHYIEFSDNIPYKATTSKAHTIWVDISNYKCGTHAIPSQLSLSQIEFFKTSVNIRRNPFPIKTNYIFSLFQNIVCLMATSSKEPVASPPKVVYGKIHCWFLARDSIRICEKIQILAGWDYLWRCWLLRDKTIFWCFYMVPRDFAHRFWTWVTFKEVSDCVLFLMPIVLLQKWE